jgi:glycosyltransferase involved in cell wall biosynthesis
MAVDRRILVISQTYPPEQGGNASRIGDTTQYLDDDGWDVTVLSPHPSYPHGQFDQDWSRSVVETRNGVTVIRLWTWQPTTENPGMLSRAAYYLLFSLHALLWLLRTSRQYDVVLTSTPPPFTALPGLLAQQLWAVPWVIDVRDLWIDAAIALGLADADGIATGLTQRLQNVAFSHADRLFATTPEMREQIVAQYPVDTSDVHVVPNGVDVSLFDYQSEDHTGTVVYAGNLGHAQELAPFIRAIGEAESELRLHIVGDGDVRPELERIAEQAGVDDIVEFTGLVDREVVPEYLDGALVGLAPITPTTQLEYAVPTKAYEYMACGVPVIATETGAVESFLQRSGGGTVVESDPAAIASILDELAQHPEKRSRLADSGQRYVRDHCTRQQIATLASEKLQRLCKEHV